MLEILETLAIERYPIHGTYLPVSAADSSFLQSLECGGSGGPWSRHHFSFEDAQAIAPYLGQRPGGGQHDCVAPAT